jgi:hypothetical protein
MYATAYYSTLAITSVKSFVTRQKSVTSVKVFIKFALLPNFFVTMRVHISVCS